MSRFFRSAGAAALLWLLPVPALADTDSQVWMKAAVSHELGDTFEVELTQHLRFDSDVSRVAAVMPEASISYQPARPFKFDTGYRLEYQRDGDGAMVLWHRVHADAKLRVEPKPVRFEYRLRFQEQIRGTGGSDDLRHKLRNRLGAELRNLDPWTPWAEAEIFHNLGRGDGFAYDKARFTAGTEYDLGDQAINLYYRLEIPYKRDEPITNIFGLEYELSI